MKTEENTKPNRKTIGTINCDQVAWLLDILSRHEKVNKLGFTPISRIGELSGYAAVLEIAEVLNFDIDKDAVFNLTPGELRHLIIK